MIPSGCTPVILDIFPEPNPSGYDNKTGCMLRYNELGQHHNTLLQESLQQIRAKNPGVRLIYADFFGPVMEMVQSPRSFGRCTFVHIFFIRLHHHKILQLASYIDRGGDRSMCVLQY